MQRRSALEAKRATGDLAGYACLNTGLLAGYAFLTSGNAFGRRSG
jgi:hypothetical protein